MDDEQEIFLDVAISRINQVCRYQDVTCYGKPLLKNKQMSFGFMIMDDERIEVINPDYLLHDVLTQHAD